MEFESENRQFYSIGEVAKIVGTNETTLRFWEKEFKELNPRRAGRGVRYYSKDDLKLIKLIYHLVKEKRLTLDGAKRRIKESKSMKIDTIKIVKQLNSIKTELVEIRNGLELIILANAKAQGEDAVNFNLEGEDSASVNDNIESYE